MTASAASPTATTAPQRVLLAAGLAAVLSGVAAAAVALATGPLGVTQLPQLTPAVDAVFAAVAAVIGAIGWQLVRGRAADPRRVLSRLVPAVLAASFVPDVVLGVLTAADTGVAPVVALALMHVTTIAISVAVYARVLPVSRA